MSEPPKSPFGRIDPTYFSELLDEFGILNPVLSVNGETVVLNITVGGKRYGIITNGIYEYKVEKPT